MMKRILHPYRLLFFLLVALTSCDDGSEDIVPETFFMIQLNPDDIYMYNNGNPSGVRLDPFVNDSIKVDVSISYSTPLFGTITFIPNEGWFYRPSEDFFGIDNIIYTVCYKNDCYSASITMHVEEPIDPENCEFSVVGENIVTDKDSPVAIRIFENDMACPYQGSSLFAPEKGRFDTYSYSGSFKNIIYVYYPPKGYVGTDRFKYRLTTTDGYLEAYCEITVK
jgi:hypothetical protein